MRRENCVFLDSLGYIVRMRPVSSLCYLFTVVTLAMMKRMKKILQFGRVYFSLKFEYGYSPISMGILVAET